MTHLVFDTTALSHFARAGRTDALQMAVASDEPVILAEVAAELARGVPDYPSLGDAQAASWLKPVDLTELPELAAFARYKSELGGGPERNIGEAAVLAWVSVNGGIAIVDEADRRCRIAASPCGIAPAVAGSLASTRRLLQLLNVSVWLLMVACRY